MESAKLEVILRDVRELLSDHTLLPPRARTLLDIASQFLNGSIELPARMSATVKRAMQSQTIDRVLALIDVVDAITPHDAKLHRALSMLLDACFRCSEKLQKEAEENVK